MPEPAIELFRITELMELFHAGLSSVLPVMERARLPWIAESPSDSWDRVQEALYDAIIGSCLEHIIVESEIRPLAPYGHAMPSYDAHSFLSARDLRLAGKPNAFFDLTKGAAPFDSAVFKLLTSDLQPTQGHIISNVETTNFEIALRSGHAVSYSDTIKYRP